MAPAPSKGIAPTDAPKATAEPSGPAATVKKVAQGALANTGAYAFDLREGWTDANGTLHTFDAVANEYVRVWIEDFTTESGNRATMQRVAGGLVPGSFSRALSSSQGRTIRGNVWYETFRLRMSSPQEGGENTDNLPDVGQQKLYQLPCNRTAHCDRRPDCRGGVGKCLRSRMVPRGTKQNPLVLQVHPYR